MFSAFVAETCVFVFEGLLALRFRVFFISNLWNRLFRRNKGFGDVFI